MPSSMGLSGSVGRSGAVVLALFEVVGGIPEALASVLSFRFLI